MKRSHASLSSIPVAGESAGHHLRGFMLADEIGKAKQQGGTAPAKAGTAGTVRPAVPPGYIPRPDEPSADMQKVLPAKAGRVRPRHLLTGGCC
jgi:hypothetical protein